MTPLRVVRRVSVAVGVVTVLLAGCTSGSRPPGGGMMRGGASTSAVGGGTMGGGSGYHFSSPRCRPPASLPGRTVQVTLADMGMSRVMGGTAPLGARMMLRSHPAAVAAGRVTLVAANRGWRVHELVVLPLATGASAGERVPQADGQVDEAGSLGEASRSCAGGSGKGIAPGAVGWMTLTLTPGRYELLCNLPNHYANRMYQELDVT